MRPSEVPGSWRTWRMTAMRISLCAFLLCCLAGPERLDAATYKLTVLKEGDANITLHGAFGLPDVLAIRYSRPSNGDTGVAVSDQVMVHFNRDIWEGPDVAGITLSDSEGTPVPFNPVVNTTQRRLVLVTSSSFAPGMSYTVGVPAGAVADAEGNILAEPYTFTFTTAVAREPKMYIAAYPSYITEGSITKVNVWFETPATQERTITLTSTPDDELLHPSEVFLEAGQVLLEVPVDSRYNHGRTSPLTVTLSAAEPGVGQRSVQIEVVNTTSVSGPFLRWQAAGVVSDTDNDGIFEAGERADIRFDVANFGSSTISNVKLDFSVVTGPGLSILGGAPYCYLGSLAPGRNGNCTKTLQADSDLPSADYYVQVIGTFGINNTLDSILDQARIPIVNNFQPDFVLNAGSFTSAELKPGTIVDLRYTARNNGDGFSEKLPFFEVTLDLPGTQQLLYQTYANARGYIWNEQSFRLPLRVPDVPGTHTIRARINPPNAPNPPGRLTESNYANNDAAVLTLRVAVVHPLAVTVEGSGSGTVTSLPGGIDCGATCSADFISGQVVTLYPTPAEGSVFTGWAGAGCSGTGNCVVTMDAARSANATFEPAGPQGLDFYTVAPCRVLDTRSSGPALASGEVRIIQVTGLCDIPADAVAVSLNLTAVGPSSNGSITLLPGDSSVPGTSSINFTSGSNRANNAILGLATDASGTLAARASLAGGGQVHLTLDVNGFFQ